jgi:hypothetical protein
MTIALETHCPLAAQTEYDEFGDRIYSHPSCEAVPYAATSLVYAQLLTRDVDGEEESVLFKVRLLASCKNYYLKQVTELATLYFPESRLLDFWTPEAFAQI